MPGLVRAERRQRPRRHHEPGRARRRAGGWLLDGQKTWTTRGAFCTHLFGLFRTDPEAERHRGLTYFLVAARRAGRHRARLRPARRRRGLRRGVLRRRLRRRRRTCLGGCSATRAGGGGDGHHRLRAGPHPALARAGSWPPPTASSTCTAHGDADDPRCATASSDAWMRRRGLPAAHAPDRHRSWSSGAQLGAGVEPHQALLVRARRRAARDSRSTCSAPTPSCRRRRGRG